MPTLDYVPPPSLEELFVHPKFFNCTVGPIGSGKTTASIMFILMQALSQVAGPDGVARTRYALSRQTLVQLKMTVLRDILHLLGPLCTWRPSENLILFNFPEVPGVRPAIFSEWFLIPLETIDDQRRLLSTQFSGIYLNEVREIDFDIVTASAGRVGRWPRVADGGCTFPFVLMDTNPPAKFSPLWTFLEVTHPDNLRFIHQPGAFEDGADWHQHLPRDYYDNLIQGQSEEWVRVHVHAEYGRDPFGQAVFGHCFARQRHAKQRLSVLPGAPLLVGIDPGLNPACVIGQIDPQGGARILREGYAQGMGTPQFVRDVVVPLLYEDDLAYRPVLVFLDPAAVQRNPNAPETAFGIIRKTFPDVRLAGTNKIDTRINVVERHLVESTAQDLPRLRVDPVQCPVLVQALDGEYKYMRKRAGDMKGAIEPLPLKNHPWSDVVDALGYLLLGATMPGGARPRNVANMGERQPSSLAWT
jgi:hypothetical protein